MRQYEPIWLQLKSKGSARLVAPAVRHRTIIQAVRKEKWRDAAYRLLMSESYTPKLIIAESDREKGTIIFKLIANTAINLNAL